MDGLFYILVHPRGDKSQIEVVDLASAVSWEASDYRRVTPHDYGIREEAILEARRLAQRYGLKYNLFESRYNPEDNEYLGEFEADPACREELAGHFEKVLAPPAGIEFLSRDGLDKYIERCTAAWSAAQR
jgi:hypothetical protein